LTRYVVLGHSDNYPRFGFSPATRYGIGCEYEVSEETFMVIELQPGFLESTSSKAKYHSEFDGL
jgi:putative acetyltransferase